MEAKVDQNVCIGCTLCATVCPEVFEMNAENKAEANSELTEAFMDRVNEATDGCPVSAIFVEE